MKRLIFTSLMVVMAAVFFAACGKSSVAQQEASKYNACLENAPAWVLAGGAEGGISAVGSAKIGAAGLSFARTEALANGRDELARILGLKVNNMLKNFTQTTGIGDSQTVDKVSASVSKQLTSQTISGSRQKDQWLSSKCGELFVLVVTDSQNVEKELKNQAISSYRNEQAIWQQMQAKNAIDEMDQAIKETMATPNNQLPGF